MSQQQLDGRGEAHDALATAVASHGRGVLSDPRILGNFVADLLPDLPREQNLLVTGAEAGIAADMTQYVEEQHIDPDTAVQLVAQSLAERRAIDPAASMWVASEYAQALGYQVRPYAQPSPAEQPGTIAAEHPTVTVGSGPTMPVQPPTPTTQGPQRPPAQTGPPPGQSWPPDPGLPDRPPPPWWTSWKKPGIVAATGVGVVAVYLIVAAVAGVFPFPSPSPTPSPSPSPAPTLTQTKTPSLAAGVVPLSQLLPAGVADPTTDCTTVKPPFHWNMPGLYDALKCTDPNLPGGQVYAYQLDSTANYVTSWLNFNKWWGFNISEAGPDCPPTGNFREGTYPWHGHAFPDLTGQVLECGTIGSGSSAAPTFAYTMPTQDAFFVAQGKDGSSFTVVSSWWSNHSMPLTSPSPTPS